MDGRVNTGPRRTSKCDDAVIWCVVEIPLVIDDEPAWEPGDEPEPDAEAEITGARMST